MENKKILLYGRSKGAELALLYASLNPEIQGVITVSPSSVVFQGIGTHEETAGQSCWTLKGENIPYLPYAPYDFSKIQGFEFLEMYQLTLEQTQLLEQARIEVEKINGPILLFTGEKDSEANNLIHTISPCSIKL